MIEITYVKSNVFLKFLFYEKQLLWVFLGKLDLTAQKYVTIRQTYLYTLLQVIPSFIYYKFTNAIFMKLGITP